MYFNCYPDELRVTLTIHSDELDNYRPETTHNFNGVDYEILGWSYTWIHPNYTTIDLRMFKKAPLKTPEQLLREQEKLLAEERYTHYKAKMEAAKKDMEYWEERL